MNSVYHNMVEPLVHSSGQAAVVNDRDRAALLAGMGATGSEVDELLRYNENAFDLERFEAGLTLPLPDEPFVACWQAWADAAAEVGVFEILRRHLPQLRFPIREGISATPAYRAATLQGADPGRFPEATGLELARPERIELALHPSLAGRIPMLIVRSRPDFVALTRALSARNEPVEIPDSKGAAMIAGFNNWARIEALRQRWEAGERRVPWAEELARIRARRELYQDRFMILSDGPYSGVGAADMGFGDAEWRQRSLLIRRDHECVHYFTRRVFDSMRNHLLDELIADHAGIVAVCGRYRADWFLRFMGLEDSPRYRDGGRLEIYRGDPPLSDGSFRVLQRLLETAARNLERFDESLTEGERSAASGAAMIAVMAAQRLEELASPRAGELLRRSFDDLRRRLAGPPTGGAGVAPPSG
jgi:Family of unknown function (DUF7005)